MIKKLLTLTFIFVLCIGFTSAIKWDNSQDYNEAEKTYTLYSMFGFDEVAKVELLSNTDFCLYDCSATIKITPDNDLDKNIKLNFYNKGGFEENINYSITYKSGEKNYVVDIPDYENYTYNLEGKEWTAKRRVGSHKEKRIIEIWKPISELKSFKKGEEYILKINAKKEAMQNIDWISTLFDGYVLNEWSWWIGVAPTSYWKLNEDSGRANDTIGLLNLTNNGGSFEEGKLNNSYNPSGGSQSIGSGFDPPGLGNFTLAFWFNTSLTGASVRDLVGQGTGSTPNQFVFNTFSGGLRLDRAGADIVCWSNPGDNCNPATTGVADGDYHRIVVVVESSVGYRLYADSINVDNNTDGTDWDAENWIIGIDSLDHQIDDVQYFKGFAWTSADVVEDWNGGAGKEADLVPSSVETILSSPIDDFNTSSAQIQFFINSTPIEQNLTNLTLSVWNSSDSLIKTNFTTLSGNETVTTNFTLSGFADGEYTWNALTVGSLNDFDWDTNRTFTVDTTIPIFNSVFPFGVINSIVVGDNETLNYSVTDSSLDTVVFSYNNVNLSFTAGINSSSFLYVKGINNGTFFANDSFGNLASNFTSWSYKFLENSITFSPTTTEGSVETFTLNLTLDESLRLTTTNLVYNNTNYAATISSSGQDSIVTANLTIEDVVQETNFTFHFDLSLDDGTSINSTFNNQTVRIITISDNCTANPSVLYNFTVRDEKTQAEIDEALNNLTVELNMQVSSLGGVLISNFSTTYNETNPFPVCTNNNFSSGENFLVDVQIRYDADGYASEFYHIQKDNLNISDFTTDIDLFDLDDTSNQIFKILYKDENFLPVEDALIQLQRKYISEGISKVVEIPKTDTDGETILNMELNEVIYTILVLKNGELLATFKSVIAECQNPSLSVCFLDLNSFASHIDPGDFTTLDDFTFTLTYDRPTRTIESIFSVPSGSSSQVKLNATLFDQLGNTQVCSDTLESSSGTLTCIVPDSFGNGSVSTFLTKDGEIIGEGIISLERAPQDIYGASIVFIGLFLMLTLIGVGTNDNPMINGILLMVGVILLVTLNIVDTGAGSFVGAGATILYVLIALLLVLIKGARRQ